MLTSSRGRGQGGLGRVLNGLVISGKEKPYKSLPIDIACVSLSIVQIEGKCSLRASV